jgi:ribosomal protein S27AE
MYAEADDGERITCPHPGERGKAREVIGEDATEAELDRRTGFNYHCVCIDCVEQFDCDPQRDRLRCPNCRSTAIELLVELVGRRCPQCGDGDFIAEDTGAIA